MGKKFEKIIFSSEKTNQISLHISGIQYYPQPIIYSIRNSEGKVVISNTGKFINYGMLPKGFYFLNINRDIFTFNL